MQQQKLAEQRSEGLYCRDSRPMHEDCRKAEKRSFDFRKMFAVIALHIGGRAVKSGYFCDVSMDVDVPRYLRGYPNMLQELVCALADHSLSEMKKGGMVIKVDSAPAKNGKGRVIMVEISDSGNGFCGQGPAFDSILNYYCDATPYLSSDRSSWIFRARQLKSPLKGRVVVHSLYGWGSRYRIEVELESCESLAVLSKPACTKCL